MKTSKVVLIVLLAMLFTGALTYVGVKRFYFDIGLKQLAQQAQERFNSYKRQVDQKYNRPYFPAANLQIVQFQNLPSVEYERIFDPEALRKGNIKTKREFHRIIMRRYHHYKAELSRVWKIVDSPKLKTFFFMNTISRLWAYGNLKHPQKSGCVQSNEAGDFKVWKAEEMHIDVYLSSLIGCCTDYTMLMRFLFERENIPNRVVTIGNWHVFNEVQLDGRWQIADANMNLFYDNSWEGIINRPPNHTFNVIMFPHRNSIPSIDPKRYRTNIEYYRMAEVYWLLHRLNIAPKYNTDQFELAGP